MPDFTVVTYFTPNFECFEPGLREDCLRLNYPFHSHGLAKNYQDVIQAFDYKISFIHEMVQRFDRVLWLDVECRIVRPLPEQWTSPLISTYISGRSQGFSSGVLMLDKSQLDFIEMWMKYAPKYPDYPDDFVLDFLSMVASLDFKTVPLEFYDRDTNCPIARGLWENKHTIIQHPTINRWPEPLKYRKAFNGKERKRRTVSELISRQRKALYYRNFAGDFTSVEQVMQAGIQDEYHESGWVFDAIQQRYAPEMYWAELADDFTAKPRSFQQSWANFNKKPKGTAFRDRAIRAMRLDAQDAKKHGRAKAIDQTGLLDRFRDCFKRLG